MAKPTPTFSAPRTGATARDVDGSRTILTYKAGASNAFAAQIAQYRASAASLHKNLAKINEQAVRELSRDAQKTLKRRVRGRGRQQSRNQTLVDLAGNHRANSTWDKDGFHFFDPKIIRYSKAFPYYRAIELGSSHMVGRYIPLTFLRGGTAVPPPSARYQEVAAARGSGAPGSRYSTKNLQRASSLRQPENIGQLKDYATYSGRQGAYVVKIRNPIRPYYYISTAVNNFVANGRYAAIVESQVRKLAPLLARNLARRQA